MTYLPEVAWSTIASNVSLGLTTYRYYITVNPLDPNEAGASTMSMAINDWFIDFAGYPFLIEEINGSVLTVYDILERGDGVVSAYAPYANKLGYVYRPLNGAIILTQAQLRKLDESAKDVIQPIEKGILWGYRGLSLADTTPIDNITNLELENIDIIDVTEEGWQGGKKVKLRASSGIEYTTIQQVGHGFTFDVVYLDSLTGLWTKALADNEETCGTHIAIRVDDDNFTIINNGEYTYTSDILDEDNNPLIPGEYYFLSQINPGKLTKVKPEEGITQYILQALGTQFVSINVEEPYEIGDIKEPPIIAKFIDLTDTPSNYEDGKFVVATIDSIVYKTPLISDISGLQNELDLKVNVSDYEDIDVLNKIKNVHGDGSGLDADLLDGYEASDFAPVSHTHAKAQIIDFAHTHLIADVTDLQTALDSKANLDSSNTFSGSNTFQSSLYLTGLTEATKSKILYIDSTTKQVYLGDVPSSSGGSPGDSNKSFQYNNNGNFGGMGLFENEYQVILATGINTPFNQGTATDPKIILGVARGDSTGHTLEAGPYSVNIGFTNVSASQSWGKVLGQKSFIFGGYNHQGIGAGSSFCGIIGGENCGIGYSVGTPLYKDMTNTIMINCSTYVPNFTVGTNRITYIGIDSNNALNGSACYATDNYLTITNNIQLLGSDRNVGISYIDFFAGGVLPSIGLFKVDTVEQARISSEGFQIEKALILKDGINSPNPKTGYAIIYVDSADGDLKIKFGDGTVKTIVTDS